MEIFVNYNQKLSIFRTPQLLADNLVNQLLKLFNQRTKQKFSIALAGGNSPKVFYQKLSSPQYNSQLDWKQIQLFWGDERCVPPDNEESNFGMANQALISNINIPQQNIHRIKGENNPEQEAERYSKELKRHLKMGNNYPCLDVIFLGLGSDGHTASLFPNSNNLEKENYCSVAVHPTTGQNRITLNLPVLLNASHIFFIVTGSEKAEIIRKIILEKNISRKYLASLINENPNVKWFIDNDAAEYLF